MDALACGDVLDFNNPAAPAAYSVDGLHADRAIANEPRHHYLSHRSHPLPQIFDTHCCSFISSILNILHFRGNLQAATNW
jgi:hypothetical protein